MAVVNESMLTLLEVAKRRDPKGKTDKIVEILNETNKILEDAPAIECNDGTVFRSTERASLPRPGWRMINKGAPTVRSETRQNEDATGLMEAWGEVDETLLELSDDRNALLLSENKAVIEGMGQEAAETLFYGRRSVNAASFDGFDQRFWSMNPSKCRYAENIIDAGGTGANLTSLWFQTWGDFSAHLIYPKGSKAGLSMKNFSNQVLFDSNGDKYEGYRTRFQWYLGLAIRDYRYTVRVANIDNANLQSFIDGGAGTAADQKLNRILVRACDLIPNLDRGRTVIYANRDVHTMLNLIAMEKSNVQLTIEKFGGVTVPTFKGIPIRRCDALVAGETQITAA